MSSDRNINEGEKPKVGLDQASSEDNISEHRLQTIINTVPVLVTSARPDGSVDFINDRWLEYLGVSVEVVRDWGWTKVTHSEDIERFLRGWRSAMASGEPLEEEARVRRADGQYRWLLIRALPLRDQLGKIVNWYATAFDIEDRKQAEEKLRRSEAYLAGAQRLSHTGSFGWRVASGELIWSAETFCILGYPQTVKPTLEQVFKRVHPDDIAFVRQTLDRATRDEANLDFEHRFLMPDGEVKQVHVLAQPTKNETGDVEFVGAVMDITERKQSQDALCAAKARFEGILEIAEDAIISVDATQKIVLFNQGAEKVFGFSATEIIGKPLDLLLPQRFAQAHQEHIKSFAKASEVSRSMAQRREVFGCRKDGSEFPAEASISKLELGDEVVFTVILRDVTEQKRLENRLRRSEKNLAEGQRLTKTGSWMLDFETGNTDWSVETCRIFGFPDPPPSPHYSEFRARVRPEDRDGVDRGLRESFETGEPRPLEYVFIMPDGTRKNIETISQPVTDETGKLKLIGTVMDVTERKRAEEALRVAEHLARGQLDALKLAMASLSRESKPEKFLEHILCITVQKLGADSISAWEMNDGVGQLDLVAVYEDGRMRLLPEDDGQPRPQFRFEELDHPVWTEFFHSGERCVFGLIESDPPGARVSFDPKGPWFDWVGNAIAHPRINEMIKGLVALKIAATLCIPMVIGGKVVGMFSMRFKQKRAYKNEEIELTKAMAHQAVLAIQLMRLSQQSRETAVMAERNRMARDIHDTLAQGFTGVIMQLEAAKGATAQGNLAEVTNRIERASELARLSLGEARRSVRALRPRSLREGKLSVALDNLLKRMTDGTELNAEFRAEGDERAISAEYEEGLLRITQESLTNVVKHASARNFKATLNVSGNKIQLQLVDDGRGFDPQNEHEGFGLIGMKERVDRMGGEFIIRSKPGVGTEILVVLKTQPTPKPEIGNE